MKKAHITCLNLPWGISISNSRYFLDKENCMFIKFCIQSRKHNLSLKT